MNNAPIGVFDSGVGGLTVARAILDQLPNEEIIYIGDEANAPYGPKPLGAVRAMALAVMGRLVDEGVKMLVIACNSATSVALPDARERYEVRRGIPVIEVIRPAARRAVLTSRTGKIGVIGTKATIESKAYEDAFEVTPGLEITAQACPDFVPLVEKGITSGPEVMAAAEEYLRPVKEAGVDTLVLGCTHYPILSGAIQYVMGRNVTLVSSAEETAKDVYRALVANDIERDPAAGPPQHRFMSTGNPEGFAKLARRFLGPEVADVAPVEGLSHMLVRTLGVTGSASESRSPASTYLVQVKAADVAAGIAAGTVAKGIPVRDWSVIVDIGQGGFGLLERHVRAHDIDAVAISHFHADHFSDICSFYVHLKYHPVFGYAWSGVGPYIPVWGPSEIESHLSDSCCSIDSSNGDMAFLPNAWIDQIPVQIGPITIVPFKVWHSVESFGMRIIGPSARDGELVTISYSGDTDYCEAVVDLARDADLFLCEASYLVGRDDQAPAGIHLTGQGAGRVAREANAKKLVLVHIPSWNNPATSLAEAKTEYHGPIEVAKCNGVFEL